MNDPRRGTGRTTRMLLRVVEEAKAGKTVGVVAFSHAYATDLCHKAEQMGAPKGSVTPMSRTPQLGRGPHPDRVFHDHFSGRY